MIYSWDHLLLKSHLNLYLNHSHLTNSINKNNSPAGPVFFTSADSTELSETRHEKCTQPRTSLICGPGALQKKLLSWRFCYSRERNFLLAGFGGQGVTNRWRDVDAVDKTGIPRYLRSRTYTYGGAKAAKTSVLCRRGCHVIYFGRYEHAHSLPWSHPCIAPKKPNSFKSGVKLDGAA